MSHQANEPVVIGPCKCGGYGVVYNEKAEAEFGKCHIRLKDLIIQTMEQQRDALVLACRELIDLINLAQEDVPHHEYQTIYDGAMEQAKRAIANAEASK